VDHYRGFYFVSYAPEIESLANYLGGAREYIDLVADQSEAGIQVLPGSQRYSIGANWKLLMENSIDGYHAAPVHVTYFKYVADVARKAPGQGGDPGPAKGNSLGFGRALGNGHAAMDVLQTYGRPVARWSPLFGEAAKEQIERRRARLLELHGATKAYRISDVTTNLLVYPNLVINNGVALTIRKVDPVAADMMESTAWAAAPADEPPEMLERRLDSFLTFYGPGGFATPDDVEALESCQQGFTCLQPEYSDISRGMDRAATYQDEGGLRGFWRRWQSQMAERPMTNAEEGRLDVDWEAAVREWRQPQVEAR
jgi:p-cumate 2,3-dioxygenase alpha subunit